MTPMHLVRFLIEAFPLLEAWHRPVCCEDVRLIEPLFFRVGIRVQLNTELTPIRESHPFVSNLQIQINFLVSPRDNLWVVNSFHFGRYLAVDIHLTAYPLILLI